MLRKLQFEFSGLRSKERNATWYYVKGAVLSPAYLLLAALNFLPGIKFHLKSACFGIRGFLRGKLNRCKAYLAIFYPIDTSRYFEFDFFWREVSRCKSLGRYLDMSSPRLFPLVLLDSFPGLSADINNPDEQDLAMTKEIAQACGTAEKCQFSSMLVNEMSGLRNIYDTISSISVIEHIPDNGDLEAMQILWDLLKPGGRLFISLPCCKESFEEYINVNQFNLLKPDDNNIYFSQRYYDEVLLEQRIFCVTGKPMSVVIYGEKRAGVFFENRERKNCDCNYPFWKEPFYAIRDYSKFKSISELPGVGLIAMVFVKR